MPLNGSTLSSSRTSINQNPTSNNQNPTSNNQNIMKNRADRLKLNNNGQASRNSRIMANIQATLTSDSNIPNINLNSQKTKKKRKNSNKFSLDNISEAMERIKLADCDINVSLADVRPYLSENVKNSSDEDIQKLCSCLCKSAIEQNNCYYIVDLCIDLIDVKSFQIEMSNCIREAVSDFLITNSDSNMKALPEFLAQLAVARWPRGRSRAIEDSNAILYTVINTIIGWTQFVTINEASEEAETLIDEKLELIITCTEALCTFCMVGQRSLWLSYPEAFDAIYAAIKSLLISDLPLTRSLKANLLLLISNLNKWTLSNTKKYTNVSTQTSSHI